MQQEYDNKYYIVPLSFAREVLEYDNDISAIEIKLKDPKQTAVVKERLIYRDWETHLRLPTETISIAFYIR